MKDRHTDGTTTIGELVQAMGDIRNRYPGDVEGSPLSIHADEEEWVVFSGGEVGLMFWQTYFAAGSEPRVVYLQNPAVIKALMEECVRCLEAMGKAAPGS